MKKLLKISILIIVAGLFFNRPPVAHGSQVDEMNAEIQKLNNQIASQKNKIGDLQNKQKQYLDLINQKQSEQNTLSNEVEILDNSIASVQTEIDANQLETDTTNLEIKKTTIDIQNKQTEIETEKDHMAALLKMLYKQDQVSDLEILLLNNSLADFINQVKYLENTNDEVAKSVATLKDSKDALDQSQAILLQKQADLTKLAAALDDKKSALDQDQEDKNYIIEASHQSEQRYQSLLQQARQQELNTSAEITNLAKTIQQKLDAMKNKPALNYSGLIWPVPKNRINTYFHDPSYPFRNIIGEHPGWDIRAAYGTTLRAAADGYVARETFDGSKNYAYIMLIHGNGLSTVYGHVSAVSVKANDYVVQGQVIGKTGGTPGAPGSGPFTTGAHLHFEVRKDGIPVDPAGYLQ